MRKLFTILSLVFFAAGAFAATEPAWYNDVTSITANGQYYIYSVNGKGFMQAGKSTVQAITATNYTSASAFKFTISKAEKGNVKSGNHYLKSYTVLTGSSNSGPVCSNNTDDGTTIIWTSMNSGEYWNIHGFYNAWTKDRYPALYYKDGKYDGYLKYNGGISYSSTKDLQTDAEYRWYLVSQAQLDRHFAILAWDTYKESCDIEQYQNQVPAAYYTALQTAYNKTFDVQNAEHTAEVVNNAKTALETLYTGAADVKTAYATAKGAIDALAAVEDKGEDYAQITTDIANARTALGEATTVAAIQDAVANLKAVDPITFSVTEFVAGKALGTPASTGAGRTITYVAANKNIINAEGMPIYKGTTTLTATAEATDAYYKFVRTANVTVKAENTSAQEQKTIVVGANEFWHGEDLSVYTVGKHEVTFDTLNVYGGAHTITLTLTVTKEDTEVVPVELSFCEGGSASFRDSVYTEAGSYEYAVEGVTADTLYQITVTELFPSETDVDMEIYYGDTATWNGYDLSVYAVDEEPHELTYTTTNVAGCDSVVTLYLYVLKRDAYEEEKDLEFCEGDSVEYRGVWYTEAGEFSYTIEYDIQDTIVTVNVTVNKGSYSEETMTVLAGNKITLPEGDWTINETVVSGEYQTLRSDTTGLVFVQYDQTEEGCESIYKLIVTVTPNYEAIDNVSVDAKAEKFFRNGTLYIRRGDRIFTAEGREVK